MCARVFCFFAAHARTRDSFIDDDGLDGDNALVWFLCAVLCNVRGCAAEVVDPDLALLDRGIVYSGCVALCSSPNAVESYGYKDFTVTHVFVPPPDNKAQSSPFRRVCNVELTRWARRRAPPRAKRAAFGAR